MQIHNKLVLLDYDKFLIGSSFFIPGLDHEDMKKQIIFETRHRKMKVDIRVAIENGVLGLRVWRIP